MAKDIKLRSINTHFWDDTYIVNLDPIEKLLFLYFLTNPLTNLAGVYEISIRRVAFDTGIDKDMVLKILERFRKDNKMIYENNYLIINNFSHHQKYNDSMKINVNKTLNELPDEIRQAVPTLYPPCGQVEVEVEDEIEVKTESSVVMDKPKLVQKEYFTDMLPIDSTQQFIEAWNEWCDFRREIKKKLTKLSAKKQLTFLFNQPDPIKCINQSIQNGWTGLFEVTDKTKPKVIEHNGRVVTTKENDDWKKVLAENEKKLKEQGAWDGKINL